MILVSATDQANLELFCRLKGLSELNPAAVRLHVPDLLLMELDRSVVQARASLWWNHVPEHGADRLGLIGHYAAQDKASAAILLNDSCRILAEQGCTLAVGPIDGSTWRRYRLLTERGNAPPFLLEPDNPDDWPQHFEETGFRPLARYYSSINEDNSQGTDHGGLQQRCEQAGYHLRALASDEITVELDRLWQLSCEGFKDNFLYSPITHAEFLAMYAPLLPQIQPELIQIVECQGTPVAFCLALPNLLQINRGQSLDTVIVKSLAVLPSHRGKGLAALMLAQINRNARLLGMHRTIHALMHENNSSRQLNRAVMRDFRCYTLYARAL